MNETPRFIPLTWNTQEASRIRLQSPARSVFQPSMVSWQIPADRVIFFVSVNHAIDSKRKWQKSFVVGLKVPFDEADIVKNGIHLPMPYQTSLGTTDLVLGFSYIRKSFGATLALQQPLKKMNGNRFLPVDYPAASLAAQYLRQMHLKERATLCFASPIISI